MEILEPAILSLILDTYTSTALSDISSPQGRMASIICCLETTRDAFCFRYSSTSHSRTDNSSGLPLTKALLENGSSDKSQNCRFAGLVALLLTSALIRATNSGVANGLTR